MIKIMIFSMEGKGGLMCQRELHKKASIELVTWFPNIKQKQTKNLGKYSQMKISQLGRNTISVHFIIYVTP